MILLVHFILDVFAEVKFYAEVMVFTLDACLVGVEIARLNVGKSIVVSR